MDGTLRYLFLNHVWPFRPRLLKMPAVLALKSTSKDIKVCGRCAYNCRCAENCTPQDHFRCVMVLYRICIPQKTSPTHLCSQANWEQAQAFKPCIAQNYQIWCHIHTAKETLRGYCTPGPYFLRLWAFSQKIKQLWTKYPMDLVRNVPRNSKITVLLQ